MVIGVTGAYLAGDYLYHHWTPFRDVANDVGHATVKAADVVEEPAALPADIAANFPHVKKYRSHAGPDGRADPMSAIVPERSATYLPTRAKPLRLALGRLLEKRPPRPSLKSVFGRGPADMVGERNDHLMKAVEEGTAMAQKVQVMLLCDLEDGNTEAQETVQFAVGSASYEIDVCATHAQQIRSGLEPYVTHARKAVSATSGRRRRGRSAVSGAQSANIRTWAKERGLQVNERGRIPESVVAEYEQAH